jgi:glycine dehydrogenase
MNPTQPRPSAPPAADSRPESFQIFARRHLGPSPAEQQEMLAALGVASLDALADRAVPAGLRLRHPLDLPPPATEFEALRRLRTLAAENRVHRSYLGMGYYDCITPPVIQRNLLENPGWYTSYTPYQSEISQGRLESLLNFQTLVCELTGMAIANASLLDEATAAAEAMMMAHRLKAAEPRSRFLVARDTHPQTIEVVCTRARPLGVEVVVGDPAGLSFDAATLGVLLQYPATDGAIRDDRAIVEQAHAAGALVIVATDLLSLTLLEPPGAWGADMVVGSAQRFGVPLGFGGPHAAFLATRDAFKRQLPGRLVGVSKDARGRPAFRLALGTREQHIRREKATSNICTAQALLANIAAMYAVYHGPQGLQAIAAQVHQRTVELAAGLLALGHHLVHRTFFDTLTVRLVGLAAADVHRRADARGINLRPVDAQTVGISLDETATPADVTELLDIFAADPACVEVNPANLGLGGTDLAPRASAFLMQPVFNRYHSETEMLRYLRRLEARDFSLCHGMIPLGSCTMKLNATSEMLPLSWPEFARVHPFAPAAQTRGYQRLLTDLERWLAELTGFAAISLQPNAGSQGEYAGLLVIRRYHESRGETHRDVCLIPTSAHGTNPASAVMAGLRVVPVACDAAGNVDLGDLRAKAAQHREHLAALMITYPSTHGVFEAGIREICAAVHEHGGQVYLDGANLNALVGLARPAELGADVGHLNLHKTFCIPHGGGGPGVGPIGVAPHLADYLPGHRVVGLGSEQAGGAVAAAPFGSASLLPISWMYIACMGAEGLTRATQVAILNANYVARRLDPYFPVLYRGAGGWVAHECILDLRPFHSVTAEDVAKRLMDYGFHAPTLSWPVAGTLMVEPTESESKRELDRFCEAMIAIHAEITAIETGRMDRDNNPLKHAPHPADTLAVADWDRPYSREQAAFPVPELRDFKFWPAVARVDNVFGDRNPVCTCAGMDAYETPKP